jgi:hypothetical protein
LHPPWRLLAFVVHERWVRPALLHLLPPGLASALQPQVVLQRKRDTFLSAIAAIWLATLTHIVWDAFTHDYGWGVTLVPALRAPILPSVRPELAWFKVLQHGSTVVGSLILLAWATRWVTHQPPAARRFAPGQRARSLQTVAVIVGTASAAGVLNAIRVRDTGLANILGYTAVGGMSALAFLLFGYALLASRDRDAAT